MSSLGSDAYAQLVEHLIAERWAPFILTLMFSPLPGGARAVQCQMMREVERLYGLHVTRVVRCPQATAAGGRLPVGLIRRDLPVYTRARQSRRDVTVNGGLHPQGIGLLPPWSRCGLNPVGHFRRYYSTYVPAGGLIDRLHVEPITEDVPRVAGYVLKALERGWIDPARLLILPRTIDEMRHRRPQG